MNSVRKVALIPSLLSLFMLVSCGSTSSGTTGNTSLPGGKSSGAVATTYTITFNSNGGSAVAPLTVNAGSVASKPADPNKSGYAFSGWFEQDSLVAPFDWNLAVTSDWTLYAGWTATGSSSVPSTSAPSSSAPATSAPSTSSGTSLSGVYYLDFSAVSFWADGSAILNAHYWCGTSSENTTWPGIVMNKVSASVYSINNVPSDVTGFVFNRQNPDSAKQSAADKGVWNQSVDALVESGKNCFTLTNTTDSQGHYQGSWTIFAD
jgi:uncharacterized repeat protein (TIGR02543 family)